MTNPRDEAMAKALHLLQASSCFRSRACSVLPCACAESLVDLLQIDLSRQLAEAQRGVTKAMRAILEAAFAVQSRPASAVGEIEKRLLRYCDDLDHTERPAKGEYDVTADIRAVLSLLSRKKPEHTAALQTSEK